ncbi:MAG: hypothetical protein IJB49_03770 [Clostridia bacterium]|nr:hypothetical protein [Clostridia bacterium]
MGFGIALIGYAFLLLNEMGGAVLAAPLLAYGLFLASRLESGFLRASVCSLFLLPRGVLQVCSVIGALKLEDHPTLNTATYFINLAAWLLMSYFWLTTVAKIAKDCNAAKLERQARNRLAFTAFFIMLSFAAFILNLTGVLGGYGYIVSSAQYILQYTVIIVNTIFMHTCFVLITSERQFEKDKQELAKEHAKALEKRHKEQQEEAERIARRKKR